MTPDRQADDVVVTRAIEAPAEAVYALVSDVTRMGEWSPETASCRWVDAGGSAEVGARFRGSNRRGPLLWTTTCTVTSADPGRRFAFTVTWARVPISDWAYDLVPAAAGCTVSESWTDRRPAAMRLASVPVMGIADRAGHNRRGMEVTLSALARAAETT